MSPIRELPSTSISRPGKKMVSTARYAIASSAAPAAAVTSPITRFDLPTSKECSDDTSNWPGPLPELVSSVASALTATSIWMSQSAKPRAPPMRSFRRSRAAIARPLFSSTHRATNRAPGRDRSVDSGWLQEFEARGDDMLANAPVRMMGERMQACALGHRGQTGLLRQGRFDGMNEPARPVRVHECVDAVFQRRIAHDAGCAEDWDGSAKARLVVPEALPAVPLRRPGQPGSCAALDVFALAQAAARNVDDIAAFAQ